MVDEPDSTDQLPEDWEDLADVVHMALLGTCPHGVAPFIDCATICPDCAGIPPAAFQHLLSLTIAIYILPNLDRGDDQDESG